MRRGSPRCRPHDPESFFRRLADLGVLVRPREMPPGHLVGYAVAAPGDVNADGQPVWFGGRRLASDLSLPALLARWQSAAESAEATRHRSRGRSRSGGTNPRPRSPPRPARSRRRRRRCGTATRCRGVDRARHRRPADRAVHGHPQPRKPTAPVWLASDEFDRAARTPHLRQLERRPGRCAPAARELRRVAWHLAAIRLPKHRRDDTGTGELMMAIAVLIAEIAQYHQAHRHHAQAAAAHRACRVLPRHRTRPDRVQSDRAGRRDQTETHAAGVALRALQPSSSGRPPHPGATPGGSPTGGRPSPIPPVVPRPRPPNTGRGRSH